MAECLHHGERLVTSADVSIMIFPPSISIRISRFPALMVGDRIGAITQQCSEPLCCSNQTRPYFIFQTSYSAIHACAATSGECRHSPIHVALLAPQTQAHIRLGVGLAERQAQAQRTRNLHASDLHGGGGAGLSGGGRSQAAGERRQRDDRPKSGGREHGSLSSSKPYSNPVYIFLR